MILSSILAGPGALEPASKRESLKEADGSQEATAGVACEAWAQKVEVLVNGSGLLVWNWKLYEYNSAGDVVK